MMLIVRILTAIMIVVTVGGMILGVDWNLLRFALLAAVVLVMVNVFERLMKPQAETTPAGDVGPTDAGR